MRIYSLFIGCLASYVLSFSAHANIVLGGTRLVYPQGEREVTIALSNKGTAPALVQAWMDDGSTGSTPENSTAPFLINPPITRIEGQGSQTLRIFFEGAVLPADRESLFWLNVLEIPPVPQTSKDKNNLLLAVQSRIKVFYRPTKMATTLHDAAKNLKWRLQKQGNVWQLHCRNTSPFYISFAEVNTQEGGETLSNRDGTHMIAPSGEKVFDLTRGSALHDPLHDGEVRFEYINDYGALKVVDSRIE